MNGATGEAVSMELKLLECMSCGASTDHVLISRDVDAQGLPLGSMFQCMACGTNQPV
jgi:uncharacterized Zn finger protein